jgi:predicted Zn-dependent protease
MSLAEIRAARPQHLKMVTVRAGDTVERLARRMAPGDHQVDRFRVLNGLTAADKVKPGDVVKVVVD